MTKHIKLTIFVFASLFANLKVLAQCNPSYTAGNSLCQNTSVNFKANAPGFSSYTWEFKEKATNKVIGTSNVRDPGFVFMNAGVKVVNLKASGVAGTCDKTIELTIKPSPIAKPILITPQSQCYKGNLFCIIDSSTPAPGSQIVRGDRIFNDGRRIDAVNPTLGDTFCHSIIDPKGGKFNMKMVLTDANGCVTEAYFDDYLEVFPHMTLGLKSNEPTRCDSTKATITNTTYTNQQWNRPYALALKDVAHFKLDFGGGSPSFVMGDSTTNTDYWTGKNNDGIIEHWYYTTDTFDVKLFATSRFGCTDSVVVKQAATNVYYNPAITHNKKQVQAGEEVTYRLKEGTVPGSAFLWNFGDPVSGADNFNNETWEPRHAYSSLGPKMTSIRIIYGPCDKMAFDTIEVVGPSAQIESPGNRILEKEKFQCTLKDTVHFPNNSTFWGNDDSGSDEDSVVYVNGEKRYVFNFDSTTRTGDQAAVTTGDQTANRTGGNQIFRLWNFGDEYANQCTTSSKLNMNINKNCNYSTDKYPVHKYQEWDSIYHRLHYLTNDTFYRTVLKNGTCNRIQVDTSDKALHRTIFTKTIAHNFRASLFIKDTSTQIESTSYVDIIGTKPDASKMKISSGQLCPIDGSNLKHYITFDLNTGGQSYFAVNFDSAANPSNFIPSNSGGILALPAPGSPIPFVLPYQTVGAIPTRFVKGYTQGELGKETSRKENSIGLVVGNGPLGSNGEPPECLDTAWYNKIANFNVLHSDFTILGGKTPTSACKGDTVFFKLNKEVQDGLKTLSWNWGNPSALDMYYEEFKSLEKYTGPVSTRNDKDIVFNGEDWLYNYVVRHEVTSTYGDVVLDTIVTAIIKDYWLDFDKDKVIFDLSTAGNWVDKVPHNEVYKYIGNCLDTTGITYLFTKKEFRETAGGLVFSKNGKRYRYTDKSKQDSVVVADVLHFRDSSLRGFDSYFDGKDTIHGVWKHVYQSTLITDKSGVADTSIRNISGAMTPSLYLSNIEDCEVVSNKAFNVGHLVHISLEQDAVCKQQSASIDDSVRYWQLGDVAFPDQYPIDPRKFWEDPVRYAQGKLEIKSVDWDASDGIGNEKQRSIRFFHQYDAPGEYDITVFTKDSLGCRDTAYITAEVTGLKSNFYTKREQTEPCKTILHFYDSTHVFSSNKSDSVIWYEWDFGDGSTRSVLKNPSHEYLRYGWYTVKLRTFSLLGCQDSIIKQIYVPGPQPKFRFASGSWGVPDSLFVTTRDTVTILNLSIDPMYDPSFVLGWGDNVASSTSSINHVFKHVYKSAGTYYPNMLMDDTSIDGGRCFAYYPYSNTGAWTPSKDFKVVVTAVGSTDKSLVRPNVQIYPNPNRGEFSISTVSENEILSAELRNIFGQKVPMQLKQVTSNRVEVFTSKLSGGTYFLIVTTEKGTVSKKVTLYD